MRPLSETLKKFSTRLIKEGDRNDNDCRYCFGQRLFHSSGHGGVYCRQPSRLRPCWSIVRPRTFDGVCPKNYAFDLLASDLGVGGAPINTLAGSGNDVVLGGTGNDFIAGGSGNDIFVFYQDSGGDRILDFRTGQDKIDLSAFDITDFHELEDHISGGWFHTSIDLGDTHIALNWLSPWRLDADDFIL